MVNGPAMVLAIANNIFSLRGSRGNEETYDDFWRSAEVLVGNRQQALTEVVLNLPV